ncbi:MAG: tyrosine--tRNA ligase [Halobacteriovoraceae bacterium]|nr:tyrosine--tRNA ligase [Halobacteriovoraceae bacterium]|tara:strand:+ start:9391 stop:10611 length:1221 start_codon:yes stop_codon:yes gene_type:complete
MSKISVSAEDQLKELKRGAVDVMPEEELLKKLKKSKEKDKPLVIKFGADPSRPDIHLGHTVVLQKLKILQDFGHDIYFLIGDFTARIGDPSGKSKTRPILTDQEVMENAKTYAEQVGKILDMEKTKIVFNNDWLSKLSPIDMIQIMAKVTVSSILERDDFTKRFKAQEAIYMHEFAYPLMQGYDSVAIEADLELGGTDQTFNLLMGRHLQKAFDKEPQCILTMPILEGTDGVQKMSKSLDNYISLEDTPTDMFGKMMSISDDLMVKYYELLSRRSADEITTLVESIKSGKKHPMDAKKELAAEIVDYYHPEGTGAGERQKFEDRFAKNKIPDDIPVKEVEAGTLAVLDFFRELEFIKSNGEGRRLIKQNAFKLDGKACKEENLELSSGAEHIFKLGKLRMVKVIVK